jgi:outer membrane protein assembly factor BamB
LTVVLVTGTPIPALATDTWPAFRGAQPSDPGPDAAVTHALPDDEFGLTTEWTIDLGSGYSNVAITDDRIYTLFTSGEHDVAAAFAAADGKELWRYPIAPKYAGHDTSDDGPHSTPTVTEDSLYAVGPRGQVFALNKSDGTLRWQYDLDESNSTTPFWGYATSPVVYRDRVLILTGGEGHAITALDRSTGQVAWTAGDDSVAYQTPSLLEIEGRVLLVAATDHTIYGVDPLSGEILFQEQHTEGQDGEESGHITSAGDGRFLVNFDRGARLYQASLAADGKGQVEELWQARAFNNTYAIPVKVGDHFYGFTRSILTCVDAETGEIVWRSRELDSLGLMAVGNILAILEASGELVLVNATPEGYQERTRTQALVVGAHTFPAFAGNTFVVRNHDQMASLRVDRNAPAASSETRITERYKGDFGDWIQSLEQRSRGQRQKAVDEYFRNRPTTPLFEGDRLVHFVWRGEARDVAVSGEPTNFAEVGLERVEGTDLFFVSLELVPAAQYAYTFAVDYGAPVPDPGNPYRIQDGEQLLSDLRMPDWPPSPHLDEPSADTARGTVDSFQFRSTSLGNTRQISVWRPADYATSDHRYPVLIVNHGDNVLRAGQMDNTLDNMTTHQSQPGEIQEVIAVFVPRVQASEYGGEHADAYNRFLIEELLPHLTRHYRIESGKRAIMGSGSAGVAAVYAALRHPEVFDRAAAQSFYPIEPVHQRLSALISSDDPKPEKIFVAYSNRDYDLGDGIVARDASRELLKQLRATDIEVTELVSEYSPAWGGWRGQHDDILRLFFALSP